jgi:hypothetical protein
VEIGLKVKSNRFILNKLNNCWKVASGNACK